MQYQSAKVLSVNGNDTTVKFTFDDGSTSTQTLASLPLYNPEELDPEELKMAQERLKNVLVQYANAYIAGKAVEDKQEVTGLEGVIL